jgi:hypothetical protein
LVVKPFQVIAPWKPSFSKASRGPSLIRRNHAAIFLYRAIAEAKNRVGELAA